MLNPLFFTPFQPNQLTPAGWFKRQLALQADGLSGHLDTVWPDVRDSQWIGGDQEGWERVPYWLDGFIPLAWLLDDKEKKARAAQYIDAILARQQADGWLCPCAQDERAHYDMWALFLICKVLVVYHDCTGDDRMEPAVYKALFNLNRHIDSNTLKNWAAARWFECLIPLFWLYERKPEEWMLDLCYKLDVQGTDYEKIFAHWRFEQPKDQWSFMTHVVNLAMMLKSRALFSRVSGENPNAFARKALTVLLRDHGMAVGHFTGDECLSGTSPVQGSECCSVAEVMYSYEWLIAITGDSEWSDRLEIAAFNTFPATNSPDMWTHQYDQMSNQIQCSVLPENAVHFRTNGGESHLFGLEPNYGCCTANFNQAFPKFALSALMKATDGVAVTAILPIQLKTVMEDTAVEIGVTTDYPFQDEYVVTVSTSAPVAFTLYVRVPGSAVSAKVDGVPADTGFVPVKRVWSGTQSVNVSLSFVPELRQRPGGLNCVWRGPLLFALPLKEEWRKREYTKDGVKRQFPYCDYEVFPLSQWNYAFASDSFAVTHRDCARIPFNPDKPPVTLTATMVPIPWDSHNGVCAAAPSGLTPCGGTTQLTLIPYGCTNLRMTEMPYIP